MKILHTSDWHLGKSLHDFSLLEDQAHFITWLLDLLEQEQVDAVVIAGDIYDRPVPAGNAIALYDKFLSQAVGEMSIPVVAIAGNHDSASRLQFGSSLYQKSGYHIAGSIRAVPTQVLLGDACFTLLPYLHPAEVRAMFPDEGVRTFDDAYRVLLDRYREHLDTGCINILVGHGFFCPLKDDHPARELLTSDSEIGVGGMDLVDSAHLAGFDYAALGHLHAPQKAGEQARYSGSPLKYSLSEETQKKSVTVVDLAKGSVSSRLIPVPALRDVRRVRGTMEELLEPSCHRNQNFGDYVFADIEGEECPYPMQKLRTLFPRLLGLRFVAQAEAAELPVPRMEASQRIARLSAEELFCRFYQDCRGDRIPEDYLAVVRETLEELQAEEAEAII